MACRDGPYQPLVGVPPPGGGGLDGAAPPQGPGAFQPGVAGPSWFTVMILVGASVTTLAGGFVLFILYLRPVLKAAERAAAAAEEAAKQMEVAAQVRTLQGSLAAWVQEGIPYQWLASWHPLHCIYASYALLALCRLLH